MDASGILSQTIDERSNQVLQIKDWGRCQTVFYETHLDISIADNITNDINSSSINILNL